MDGPESAAGTAAAAGAFIVNIVSPHAGACLGASSSAALFREISAEFLVGTVLKGGFDHGGVLICVLSPGFISYQVRRSGEKSPLPPTIFERWHTLINCKRF